MYDLFDICVEVIKYLSRISGFTYEEVNIILFVLLHPYITIRLAIKYYILKYTKHEKRNR